MNAPEIAGHRKLLPRDAADAVIIYIVIRAENTGRESERSSHGSVY